MEEVVARFELVPLDELVIFIHGTRGLVFHFLGDVFEEARPSGCGPELGDVVCSHLNTLIGSH